jgi:hypothetical protein
MVFSSSKGGARSQQRILGVLVHVLLASRRLGARLTNSSFDMFSGNDLMMMMMMMMVIFFKNKHKHKKQNKGLRRANANFQDARWVNDQIIVRLCLCSCVFVFKYTSTGRCTDGWRRVTVTRERRGNLCV